MKSIASPLSLCLQALSKERETGGLYEGSLIDDGRLYCMEQLSSWEEMEQTLLVNLDNDLNNVWANQSKVRFMWQAQELSTIIGRWVGSLSEYLFIG